MTVCYTCGSFDVWLNGGQPASDMSKELGRERGACGLTLITQLGLHRELKKGWGKECGAK